MSSIPNPSELPSFRSITFSIANFLSDASTRCIAELIEGLKKLYNREGKWQSSRALGGEKSSEAKRKSEKGQSHVCE